MFGGKPGVLQADIEKIAVLDPRTRETRKNWLLTGNFVSCYEREESVGIISGGLGSLNKRLQRGTSGTGGGGGGGGGDGDLGPPFDRRGPWFHFTIHIGKTKVPLSAASSEERAAWVEWFQWRSAGKGGAGGGGTGKLRGDLGHLPRG